MDEVEEFLGEEFFDEEEPGVSNQNEVPSDAEVINKAFKNDEAAKVTRKMRPQPKFREIELCGPKGIATLEQVFKDQMFDTKENPYKNLATMMNKIEYWAHLFHPSITFDDFIGRVEVLGEKRMVQNHMNGLRLGFSTDEAESAKDDEDQVGNAAKENDADEIDEIINQYYEDPDSVIVSSARDHQAVAQGQDGLIDEEPRLDLEELRKKRNAFFDRSISEAVEEPMGTTSDFTQSETARENIPMQDGSNNDPNLMDDLDALEFIYSTE